MYRYKEISFDEFCNSIAGKKDFIVDINALCDFCAASPIHAHFKTTNVLISDTYPESIVLIGGENYINIGQIQKISRKMDSDNKYVYEILCGRIKELQKVITLFQL